MMDERRKCEVSSLFKTWTSCPRRRQEVEVGEKPRPEAGSEKLVGSEEETEFELKWSFCGQKKGDHSVNEAFRDQRRR